MADNPTRELRNNVDEAAGLGSRFYTTQSIDLTVANSKSRAFPTRGMSKVSCRANTAAFGNAVIELKRSTDGINATSFTNKLTLSAANPELFARDITGAAFLIFETTAADPAAVPAQLDLYAFSDPGAVEFFDESEFKELNVVDTAFNFYGPKAGLQFLITVLRIKADRNVSNVTDAEVLIYEAASAITTTVDKVLHEEALIRGESATLNPLRILVRKGMFVNAKTTDTNIHMTIMGHYHPEI